MAETWGRVSTAVFMEQFNRSCEKHPVPLPGQWHHHCYLNFRLTKILSKIALFTQRFRNGARTRKSFIRFPLNHLQAKEQEETRAFDLHSSSTTEAVGLQMLSPRSILNCSFLPQTDDSSLLR